MFFNAQSTATGWEAIPHGPDPYYDLDPEESNPNFLHDTPAPMTNHHYTIQRGGGVDQLLERRTPSSYPMHDQSSTPFRSTRKTERVFTSQTCCADSLSVCPTLVCRTRMMIIYARYKDPAVQVRVRWITETRKVAACTCRTG